MSLDILKNLDKDNLHHAYLLEGASDKIVPEILNFIENTLGVKTTGNPDFQHISTDSFKIKDARALKALATEKGFSNNKRIFLISANGFLLEAQNALLKMFEEPIENTHFFLIVPDSNVLLRTLISRFYFIKSSHTDGGQKEAEKFLTLPLSTRIDFIKELLADASSEEAEDEEEPKESARFKALKFLNSLELVLHKKMAKSSIDISVFEQMFKVREFLRQPGSSAKSLMESIALVIPIF
jgi:hypothetical protein